MSMAWGRLWRPRLVARVPGDVAWFLILCYGAAVVALFSAGRLDLTRAALLLGAPVVAVIGILRPEWMVLVLVALPPLVNFPPQQLIVFTLPPLFGFVLHAAPRLGWATGVYPLVGIIAVGFFHQADVSPEVMTVAGGTLKVYIYYALLMLLAFHAVVSQRIRIDAFVTAFLIGVAGATVLQPFVDGTSSFDSLLNHPFQGHFSYLAVMGFGLSYVRRSLRRASNQPVYVFDTILLVVFLVITVTAFNRAVWISALIISALVTLWTGRKTFWIIGAIALAVALTVPIVAEQVVPGGSTNIADPDILARVSTGRSELWSLLWQRGVEALPLGNGWGYTASLDSADLFGFEGNFQSGENTFVYPHNDFLYLFVELGIVGVGLFVAFWVSLIAKVRAIARRGRPLARYEARVLAPVLVVMFVLHLVANGTSMRFIGTRFFIVAGLVFGLAYRERVIAWITSFGGDFRNGGRMPVEGGMAVGSLSSRLTLGSERT